MSLVKKLVIAGVAITLATGSIAWISTAVNVGEYAAEKVVKSGLLDDAADYLKTQFEEKYVSEDGTTIEIPKEDLVELAEALKSILTSSQLTSIASKYGIDLEEIANGDFSSVQELIKNGNVEISSETFSSFSSTISGYIN